MASKKKQKPRMVSDDAFKRALLKKIRLASAVVEELERGQRADPSVDAERERRARAAIALAQEKLKALGVHDDECAAARAAANAVLEHKLKKRAASAAARRDAAVKRPRVVRSDAAWALHAIAKTIADDVSTGTTGRATLDTEECETRARATAADADGVDVKTCTVALWSIAKIASHAHDADTARGTCARALGEAFEALLRRSATLSTLGLTDARAASTTLWAAASTRRLATFSDDGVTRRAVNVAAEALAANAAKANAHDAANALWGAAKLRRSLDAACVRALVGTLTSTESAERVKVEEITIALWALATFAGDGMRSARACAAPLMKRAKEATKKPKMWSPRAIANACWAAGKLVAAFSTATSDDTEDDNDASEACMKDAKQLVTSLIPAAKCAALTAQGFAHVLGAAAAVAVDARCVGDLAKFAVNGLKTYASTLTSTDLASVVEAVRDLKLCSSMSDGTKLAEDVARAVEHGVEACDWQACGRLDVAIDDVVREPDVVAQLRKALNARGKAACDAVDAKRLDIERGAANALLSLSGDASALVAPFDTATMLVVDDKHRLVTKKLRRVGWQTTMWQRFSCGEHAQGAAWLERASGDVEPFAAAVVRAPPTKASLDMILHAVAANVRFGGRVWIYGAAVEGIGAVIADLPKGMFKDAKLKMIDAEFGVVRCIRSDVAAGKKSKALKKWREKKPLDLTSVIPKDGAGKRVKDARISSWISYPGLFAGGGLDIMTSALLRRFLPTLERKGTPRVLDYCSGNGVIAAATKLVAPKTRITVLDADACAIDACKKNLPDDVSLALSDGWTSLAPNATFDIIVSNPPVHLGVAVDFEPTRILLAALPSRLATSGLAYIVTQQYVPMRALATDAAPALTVNVASADGRFVVWKCTSKP